MDSLEIMKAIEDQSTAVSTAVERYKTESKSLRELINNERKQREALELKLGRLSLGGGSGGNLDTKGLHDEREALGAFIAKGDSSKLIEMKAMSVGNDPNGGYVVLPEISASMATKIFNQSAIRRLARVVPMVSGDAWEERVDADEPDAEWVGESQARNETDTPQLGNHRVPLHEIHASPQTTQKLLDTSYMDVGAWLEGKVADKFGRTEGVAFITGNGVSKPTGFLAGTIVSTGDATRAWGSLQYQPSGKSDGLATTNPGDALHDVMWSLRAPYRQGAVWLMNSATANSIDKIKTGTGEYIWRDGMTAGAPPSLLGYPVEFDENMPDISTNTYPIAFGNFKLGYVIPELNGLRVLRDPFSAKPNVVFYTYKRVGGDVSNSEAIKLLKIAAS